MHTSGHIQIWPLDEGFGDGACVCDATPSERLTEAEARAWQELCAANPSLHNGSIWTVTDMALMGPRGQEFIGQVKVAPEQFARLALARVRASKGPSMCGEPIRERIQGLGVKCLVLARNNDGHLQVLLAKRGNQANMYPGLWEVAPAGMVEGDAGRFGLEALRTHVQLEGLEELGIDVGRGVRWVCVLKDQRACTADFVCVSFQQELAENLDVVGHVRSGKAEHVDARWVNLAERARICQEHAGTLSPPTQSLLGWPGLTLLD
jgi:8-oxo-dGTP pyrophosphatase MutT (NUDIX family)